MGGPAKYNGDLFNRAPISEIKFFCQKVTKNYFFLGFFFFIISNIVSRM